MMVGAISPSLDSALNYLYTSALGNHLSDAQAV